MPLLTAALTARELTAAGMLPMHLARRDAFERKVLGGVKSPHPPSTKPASQHDVQLADTLARWERSLEEAANGRP